MGYTILTLIQSFLNCADVNESAPYTEWSLNCINTELWVIRVLERFLLF